VRITPTRSRHRAARPRRQSSSFLGERARRWGAPRGSPAAMARWSSWPRPGRGQRSRERPGEPAPMRAGPRRNPSRGSRAAPATSTAHSHAPVAAARGTRRARSARPRARKGRVSASGL